VQTSIRGSLGYGSKSGGIQATDVAAGATAILADLGVGQEAPLDASSLAPYFNPGSIESTSLGLVSTTAATRNAVEQT
jgi:hypothetical protein